MGFHANTFNRSLALDLILFFFQTMPHENKMQFLGRATGAAEKKSVTSQKCWQLADLLYCLYIF
jgi:hypothetical protein